MITANIRVVVAIASVLGGCKRAPNEQRSEPAQQGSGVTTEELEARASGAMLPGVEPFAAEERRVDSRPDPASCSLDPAGGGCASDENCAAGTTCSCYKPGTIGACVASDCRLDTDCRGGVCAAAGAITGESCSTRAVEYRCTKADDQCEHSLDCTSLAVDATCVFDRTLDHRICTRLACRG